MTVKVLQGDCIEMLKTLPNQSVHCCVTSPPYWRLRDYGVAGQIGLEETPAAYIAKMLEVFTEVGRVLRDDGTLWVNLGDSYAATGKNRTERQTTEKTWLNSGLSTQLACLRQQNKVVDGLKPKDLVGIPWRFAFALQDAGWYLRSDIIWAKPNPMPESVRDRPTKAHEYIFLLTKQPRYYYDVDAIKEDAIHAGATVSLGEKSLSRGQAAGIRCRPSGNGTATSVVVPSCRNVRTVWTMTTKPFAEAHFATFPPELPERCIKAGTSERGCCSRCGSPWKRIVEKERKPTRPGTNSKVNQASNDEASPYHEHGGIVGNRDPQRHCTETRTIGWEPTCKCEVGEPVPCVVLDPFGGAGTTGLVADRLGRDAILIELNPEYAAMTRRRIAKNSPLFADVR
jgi:DNA modification methylase